MASGKIRFLLQFLRVAAINENGFAAGSVAAIHIAPAVADHPALRKVNAEFARSLKQHPRLGLATFTIGQDFARMKTNFHAVNRQLRRHVRVDFFDNFLGERAPANIRLIRGNDEQKTSGLQLGTRGGNFGQNFKLSQTRRRIWLAVTFQRAIDDAVAVEENCAAHFRFPLSAFRFHFVDSHLVCATFNFGCDTSKCHTIP